MLQTHLGDIFFTTKLSKISSKDLPINSITKILCLLLYPYDLTIGSPGPCK